MSEFARGQVDTVCRVVTARAGVQAQGTALWLGWRDKRALALHRALARRAVLTRVFRDLHPAGIRFGLPGSEAEWERFDQALSCRKGMQCV